MEPDGEVELSAKSQAQQTSPDRRTTHLPVIGGAPAKEPPKLFKMQ
jgi:hypothetical protein